MQAFLLTLAAAVLVALAPGCSSLELVVTTSRLPVSLHSPSAVYDGQDTIYILGGTAGSDRPDKVLKYTLASGTIEEVGTFLNITYGTAFLNGEDITYLGGYLAHQGPIANVYKYSLRTLAHSVVSTFPVRLDMHSSVFDPVTQMAYSFGGWSSGQGPNSVFRFNAATSAIDVVAELPVAPKFQSAAVWDAAHGLAYVFGGQGTTGGQRDVLSFEPRTNTVAKFANGMPADLQYPCAAYADAHGTAFVADGNDMGPFIFNATSSMSERVQVDGWLPINHAACIYIPKLDRVYILGGVNYREGVWASTNQISYVALNTL